MVVCALAKLALLVLLKGRLVGGAKPNVPFVRWQFKIFCAVGKKLKHRRVGNECRLTRCPFVVSFVCLCSPVKMVYFFLFFCPLLSVGSLSFTLAHNGLVLAAWRHRSRKAFQQNKNSWNDRLSQTTSSHDAKTVLAAGA
jgi:hypothetical protein